MTVRLVGANPGLLLYADRDDDQRVGFASAWRVDWSERGAGTALVVWHADRPWVVTASPELTVAPVRLASDLAHGVRAEGADVALEITEPLDRRLVTVDALDLGGTPNRLSTVLIPCRHGTLEIAGQPVPGQPRVSPGPPASSSAFLADAEVWCW